MSSNILVRNVPEAVRQWIDRQRQQHGMTQQEFVLSVLDRASTDEMMPALPFPELHSAITPEPVRSPGLPFRFIDLFAGIGGFRMALGKLGGTCLFSCEWDRYSQRTYKAWYGDMPAGDIRKVEPSEIPDHDVLAAGFPCQPFSIAGVSKKKSLGQAHGFKCATQGTLFFNIISIVDAKRPPILFLENVKNLQSHDHGRTWRTIHDAIAALGYRVFYQVIDAAGWVPQHRERIYIVCFDQKVFGSDPPFEFPKPPIGARPRLRDILEEKPDSKYTLTPHLWKYLQDYAERHRLKGNGFGFGLAELDGITRTLSARYYKDGAEILIPQGRGTPRRLAPKECARLMGFDEKPIVVSDTQAYRQFGNAVVPKVAQAIGEKILEVMRWQMRKSCLIKSPAKSAQQRT